MLFSPSLFQAFLSVCRHRSFSQAARALNKTQSCISMQITQIERELGLTLLDRSARPLALTDAGKTFLEFAALMMNTIEQCNSHMKEVAAGEAGEVKIGASTSIAAFLLPEIIAQVLGNLPKVKIEISVLGRPWVYEALHQCAIHFGIVLTDTLPPEFVTKLVRKEPLCIVSSPTHPLARKSSVEIKELTHTGFIVGTEGRDYTAMIHQILKRMGVTTYPIALRISNFEGMKRAISAGVGVGILPRFTVDRELKKKTLVTLPIPGANLASSILLIERRKIPSSPCVDRVKTLVLNELKTLSYSN
jgi:DNA-binding transcriptional LysR family regulator